MKFSDRLRIAIGALSGRDVIGAEAENYLQGKAGVRSSQLLTYDKASTPETRLEPLVKNGWRRNELIYACVSKKANTASQVSLRVINASSGKPLETHPLQVLIDRPNPHMTES